MFRLKSPIAALMLLAMTSVAVAQTAYKNPICDPSNVAKYKSGTPVVKVMAAGSSAMWITMALGAYGSGKGVPGAIANTHHYVSNGKFNLIDTRPKALSSANPVLTDTGQIWIVWDEHTAFVSGTGTVCAPNVWAYVNTDSVVGNRALFGSIGGGAFGVYVEYPGSFLAGGGSGINTPLWGDGTTDTAVPFNVQDIFNPSHEGTVGAANIVNVGATDIRPEDAYFAITRANSKLGGTSPDSRDGLGYVRSSATGPNSTTPGAAPANCTGTTPGATWDDLVGNAISGAASQNGSAFNVAAFNITGQDPFTCATLPATHVLPVGALPIVFIHSNFDSLSGLSNATEATLGTVFSGGSHDASVFGGSLSGNFATFLREPLSGTYNTTEATVMRHSSSLSRYRNSMETSVDPSTMNPLAGDGTTTFRWRAIGTGNEVKSVKYSKSGGSGGDAGFTAHGMDGIGFTFFSYGNVSTIGANTNYSYITLNGVDPIWHNYVPGTSGISDPGQPATAGQLPLNTPCGTGTAAFPCNENLLWAADQSYNTVGLTTTIYPSYSYPNVRNGSYPSWSVVRLIAAGAFVNATTLVNASNIYAVTTVPDYIPFNLVKSGTTVVDPGLQILRSHYGCLQVTCGLNFLGTAVNPPFNYPERGRDAGGQILPKGDIRVNLTQDGFGFVYFQ